MPGFILRRGEKNVKLFFMNKTAIALLYGGRSGEHEISLRSAAAVYRHLDHDKYYIHLIGISRKGFWYLQTPPGQAGDRLSIEEDPRQLISVIPGRGLNSHKGPIAVDVVLPILHGSFGEDGTLQGLLEIADLPYGGAGTGSSSLSMDKETAKIIWQHYNLPVLPWLSLKKHAIFAKDFSWKAFEEKVQAELGFPVFIKPACCGSSVGVSKVENPESLKDALGKAFRHDLKVIMEPAVKARELECAVLGNVKPRAFAPGELKTDHEFYDYEAKYIDPEGAALIIPAPLSPHMAEKIQKMASKAFSALDCRGMARVDFFLEKHTEKLFINEINTIPGFTSISMFPLMCEAAGIPFSELLDEIIALAMEHHKEKDKLDFNIF